ncbi:APC family permease [Mycolicibacterium sp. HK-90]|uniref:APC family permease n=1 Tax=Mycolicibacterium sp. HK-90 TaxID=3056937 RepID=UPI00265A5B0C|nr:APC family permease [Mycolicibacterium sp. HK-90]WKG06386.1 APC family permease [Mycolicibacterium sp. HK-90]
MTDRITPRRSIGVWDLVFFVVAAAAPLAVMSGVAPLAVMFGGVGAPGGYLLGGIVMAIFAVGFTAMSRHVDSPGAFYAYISRGLGRTAGLGAAFVAVLSYVLIAVSFVPAIGVFAHDTALSLTGLDIPWQLWAVAGWLIVGALGYMNITLSAKVLGVLLGLEVLVLVMFAVPILAQGGAEGLSFGSFNPANVFGPGVGALFVLAFGAFLGFESTAIYSEEAKDPKRTVPQSTYIAVGFLALFYTVVLWAAIMAYGPERAVEVATQDPTGMFFTATEQWSGTAVSNAMHVLIVTSALAAALAFHNASARYLSALAQERALPSWLGRRTPAGSPGAASLAVSVTAAVIVVAFTLAGADPYTQTFIWLNAIGIPGIIGLQALCSAAVVAFFRRDPHGHGVFTRLIAPTVATVALAGTVILIVVNYDLLTGADGVTNTVLLLILPVTFLVGVLVARMMRARRPADYHQLATVRPDEPTSVGS